MMDPVFPPSDALNRGERGRSVAMALAAALLIASGGGGRANSAGAPSVDEQVERGFDLAYNLDHEQALAVLKQASAQDPSSSGAQRALAVVTWLNLLFTRGMVLVD